MGTRGDRGRPYICFQRDQSHDKKKTSREGAKGRTQGGGGGARPRELGRTTVRLHQGRQVDAFREGPRGVVRDVGGTAGPHERGGQLHLRQALCGAGGWSEGGGQSAVGGGEEEESSNVPSTQRQQPPVKKARARDSFLPPMVVMSTRRVLTEKPPGHTIHPHDRYVSTSSSDKTRHDPVTKGNFLTPEVCGELKFNGFFEQGKIRVRKIKMAGN